MNSKKYRIKLQEECRDLIYYISDIYLLSYILNFLSQRDIRNYSYTNKLNRGLILQLGLIKYRLKGHTKLDGFNASREFYRSGLGGYSIVGGKINYQVKKGAKITSLNLYYTGTSFSFLYVY